MTQAGRRQGTLASFGAILLVVAAALLVWWLAGGEPGTPTGDRQTGAEEQSATTSSPAVRTDPPPATGRDPDSGLPYVDLRDLPPEAARVVDLVQAGGPFAEDEDGSTFGNYEGLLPERDRGYYAEYTVPTPGLDHRGARRIVAGEGGELYWTADHYASFSRIDPTSVPAVERQGVS